MFGKRKQQVELGTREQHERLIAGSELPLQNIKAPIIKARWGVCLVVLRTPRRCRSSAQNCLDTREQLALIERLAQIIVRTRFEADRTTRFVRKSSELVSTEFAA